MLIPDSFHLGSHIVKVVKDVPLKDAWGEWDSEKKTIRLRKAASKNPQSFYVHTFLHEVVHAMLDTIGKHELSKDESFVDALSEVLAQVISTSEGGFGKQSAQIIPS